MNDEMGVLPSDLNEAIRAAEGIGTGAAES
jgi:hypothetical protein